MCLLICLYAVPGLWTVFTGTATALRHAFIVRGPSVQLQHCKLARLMQQPCGQCSLTHNVIAVACTVAFAGVVEIPHQVTDSGCARMHHTTIAGTVLCSLLQWQLMPLSAKLESLAIDVGKLEAHHAQVTADIRQLLLAVGRLGG